MADEADIAGEKAEFVHLGNLAKSRKPEGPKATGFCLNCAGATATVKLIGKNVYLNHDEIVEVIDNGWMQDVDPECVNAASLDLRLGSTVFVELPSRRVIDYRRREKLLMAQYDLDEGGIIIRPGHVFLAHTIEKCNFPDDLAALFRIKSSMGRIFLEHMDAGWVDPGFHGSLTLEFKNMSEHNSILLRPGDRIGQLVFLRGNPVSEDKSYRSKGNYCGHAGVAQVGYKK